MRHLFYPPPLSPHPTISHFFWGTLYIGRLMDGQIILYSLKLEFKVVQSHCPVSQRERRHEIKAAVLLDFVRISCPSPLPLLNLDKIQKSSIFFSRRIPRREALFVHGTELRECLVSCFWNENPCEDRHDETDN